MVSRIHGVTVCKNEADRFLLSCLKWNSRFCDTLFVYDDQSDDNSVDLASRYAEVVVRPDSVATFLVDESEFRQAGWDAFQEKMLPQKGDFILAFDLDEFWYGPSLRDIGRDWDYSFSGGIIKRPEMWSYANPLVRVDDLWKTIENIRFWPFQEGGVFRKQDLAGGSHPLYAAVKTTRIPGFLLHYGYSSAVDRQTRYERYINRGGHNTRHIKTIVNSQGIINNLELNKEWMFPEVVKGV